MALQVAIESVGDSILVTKGKNINDGNNVDNVNNIAHRKQTLSQASVNMNLDGIGA